MDAARSTYERALTWFEWISRIPRGSGDTGRASAAVASWARDRGLEVTSDESGNLVIRKDATPGREGEPSLALQAHLDMVCQKVAGSSHDFSRDPIDVVEEDGWLHADGTTLGADDGAGVAVCLAILEDEGLSHPSLEAVLTVDEEVGLVGAREMDCSRIRSRRMLNLDLTVAGQFVVGCSAGTEARVSLPLSRERGVREVVRLTLSGLRGGHSGIDIALPRHNAALLMGEVLSRLLSGGRPDGGHAETVAADGALAGLALVSLRSGEKRNAIPAEATAELALPAGAGPEAARDLDRALGPVRADLARACTGDDAGARLEAERLGEREVGVLSAKEAAAALALLSELPQGVSAMSREFPGATETSDNVSIVRLGEKGLDALVSVRTNRPGGAGPIVAGVRAACERAGAALEVEGGRDPWLCDPESPFVCEARATYRALFGEEPTVTTTHGGLECGVFSEALPGLEVFSLGPDVENAHTPSERMRLESLERLCAFVRALVEGAEPRVAVDQGR